MTTVKLKTPIEFGDETITELTFRVGRFGDLKGVKVGDVLEIPMDAIITVASRLANQPEPMIKLLEGEDIAEVFSIVMGFLRRSLETGKTPSQP